MIYDLREHNGTGTVSAELAEIKKMLLEVQSRLSKLEGKTICTPAKPTKAYRGLKKKHHGKKLPKKFKIGHLLIERPANSTSMYHIFDQNDDVTFYVHGTTGIIAYARLARAFDTERHKIVTFSLDQKESATTYNVNAIPWLKLKKSKTGCVLTERREDGVWATNNYYPADVNPHQLVVKYMASIKALYFHEWLNAYGEVIQW